MLVATFFTLSVLVLVANGYPSGAPPGACAGMFPGHDANAQSGTAPYEITVSGTEYAASGTLTVTISKTGTTGFKGFLLQARRADPALDNDELIGTFAAVADTQNVCGTNGGLTHTSTFSGSSRDSVGPITWTAPSSLQGHIYFRATIVQTKEVFWTEVLSAMVEDPTAGPITVVTPPPSGNIVIDTSGCGVSKHCISSPADCTDDCKIQATWTKPTDGKIDVVMEGTSDGWIALGFSSTDKMPDTSATVCIVDGAVVNVEQIWTTGYSMPTVLSPADTGLSDTEGSMADGKITCRFSRNVAVSGNDQFFDLNNDAYIITGVGPAGGGSITKHIELPTVTADKVNTVDDDFVNLGGSAAKSPLVRAHGVLMTFAWMYCVSVAVILARFYKTQWPGKTVLKTQVWFSFHRILQVLALAATSIAFILIFVEVQGFTQITTPNYLKAHAPLGIITTILVYVNPLMSLCRCAPDNKKRPIFNWAHWAVGTVAHILGTVALFLGINMPKAAVFTPSWLLYILIIHVVVYVLVFLVLEANKCVEAKREKSYKEEHEMTQPGEEKSPPETSPTYKNVILAVYLAIMTGLFIVMLIGLVAL